MPFKTKEEKAAWSKKYYQANKEKLDVKSKAYKDAKKDGLYTVYYLKEEHYVGITENLTYRLFVHKSRNNRHIEDVEVIGKYNTRKEATRVEAALHAMRYLGRRSTYKQQTLTQLI
jgi:hypothetical protein